MAHFSPRSLNCARSRTRTRRVDIVVSSRLEAATAAVPGSPDLMVPPRAGPPGEPVEDLTPAGRHQRSAAQGRPVGRLKLSRGALLRLELLPGRPAQDERPHRGALWGP